MSIDSKILYPTHNMGSINWIGVWTLYKREVWRFVKVWNQTVLAPVITTLLFLAILMLALGGAERRVGGLPFDQFIAPGLVMMAIVQNAFANASSSLMLSKVQGVIIDLLMPPFTAGEQTFCLVSGAVTRGIAVGIAVTAAVYIFVDLDVYSPLLAITYVLLASMMLALMGVLTGIWAQSFDQLAAITNYVITPLAFLSGTFYSIDHLPEIWRQVSYMNPFFYMIDGFRYAMTGYSDGGAEIGVVVLLVVNMLLWLLARWLFAKGYRLKT